MARGVETLCVPHLDKAVGNADSLDTPIITELNFHFQSALKCV